MRKLGLALSIALTVAAPARACIIETAICGFPNVWTASQQLSFLPDWTTLHPHELMPMGDGTFFIEFTLQGKLTDDGQACYAEYTPSYANEIDCADGNASDGATSRELGKVWRKMSK